MNVKRVIPSTSESHNGLVHSVTRGYDGACGLGKLVLFPALCQGKYLFDFSFGVKGSILVVAFFIFCCFLEPFLRALVGWPKGYLRVASKGTVQSMSLLSG